MSLATPACTPGCAPLITQVPGPAGIAGTPGPPGPAGTVSLTTYSAYASGSAYSLTATSALLTFGTTSPSVVLTLSGTYLLFSRARLDYNGATFAAPELATLKLHSATTGLDIPNATAGFNASIVTTTTGTAGVVELPPSVYVSAGAETVQLWGSVAVIPSAGSFQATQAEIVAVKIA